MRIEFSDDPDKPSGLDNAWTEVLKNARREPSASLVPASLVGNLSHHHPDGSVHGEHILPAKNAKFYGGGEAYTIEEYLRVIEGQIAANQQLSEGEMETYNKLQELVARASEASESLSTDGLQLDVPPGFKLAKFLGDHCPKSFRERVIEGFHAENTEVYFLAIKSGDTVRANRIKRMMKFWLLWITFSGLISWAFGKLPFRMGSGE
ncbi:MAG: hypothetical protein Q8R98_06695 [Rubrivivax sp.]|nr:hypothetical protein [Rubrivivax sp.]